jgi:prepilin-type N-terminal cleavage/methylation domain-containing protein
MFAENELNHLRQRGFTLIELIISIVIIGFLSLVIAQLTIQSTKGLDRITKNAVTAQSVIRFSSLIKYDFSGSTNVFIHNNTVPTSTDTNPCSSYETNQSWSSPVAGKKYTRGLFTLQINDVGNDPNDDPRKWVPATLITVGYEIRQAMYSVSTGNFPQFELWRVVCRPSTAKVSEKLLDLGKGQSILQSETDYLLVNPNFYTLTVPYLGDNSLIQKINSEDFRILRSRVDR